MSATSQSALDSEGTFNDLLPVAADPYPNLHPDLKKENRFLVFRYAPKPGATNDRKNKVPYNPRTGKKANSSELGVTYEEAVAALKDYDGIGFYLGDGWCGVDYDECVANETVSEKVTATIRAHPGLYWEASVSGTGVHGIGRGSKPGDACRKGNAEIYDSGRWFTCSGFAIGEQPDRLGKVDFTDIYIPIESGEFEESSKETKPTESDKPSSSAGLMEYGQIHHAGSVLTTRYELLMHGKLCGDKPVTVSDEFANSVSYAGRSEADLALCNESAMKHGNNPDAIWADYLVSSIYREKWGKREQDFRRLTIANAVKSYEQFRAAKTEVEATAPVATSEAPVNWESEFRSVSQLAAGGTKMLVEGFLPEGVSLLGALAGNCKTLFALSLAKALTTGKSFLGRFRVPSVVPVIYLIPESNGGSFRIRCEKFGIPNDRKLFLCRTVTEGRTLLMDDPILKAAVAHLKPVVFLDTAIRFNKSTDENSSSSNKMFVDDAFALIQAGARGVFGLHHATKASNAEGLTLENALRGTGDLAAMADAVYGLKRNNGLYSDGNGPLELEVVCLKPRDFEPPHPFTIAAKVKVADAIISHIDTKQDFALLDVSDLIEDLNCRFVEAVTKAPDLSHAEVAEILNIKRWQVQSIAKKVRFRKAKTGWCPATSSATFGTTEPAKEVPY